MQSAGYKVPATAVIALANNATITSIARNNGRTLKEPGAWSMTGA